MEITSHLPGTTYDAKRGKWKAQLRLAGKLKALGYFATQQEAAATVTAAREQHQAPAPRGKRVGARQAVGEGYQPRQELTISQQAVVKHNLGKKLVFQSNDLIEEWLSHEQKHTYVEFRLFMRMLQCLHQKDVELPPILVPVRSIVEGEGGDYLAAVDVACRTIASRVLRLSAGDGHEESFLYIPLVKSLGYEHSTRMVVGEFNDILRHHFVQLSERYTKADVETLMKLETVNAQRFYWLFKKWAGLHKGNVKNIGVDELRTLTVGTSAYGMYNDFKRLVLKPVKEELSKLGFTIDFEENKRGTSVVSLDFRVKYAELGVGSAELVNVVTKTTTTVDAKPTTQPAPVAATAPAEPKPHMQVHHDLAPEPASEFDKLLAGLSKPLQLAYARMVAADGDKISAKVAQKIIRLVAGSEAKQKTLLDARFQVAGAKLNDFPQGYTRAAHIVKAMKTIGLVLD